MNEMAKHQIKKGIEELKNNLHEIYLSGEEQSRKIEVQEIKCAIKHLQDLI